MIVLPGGLAGAENLNCDSRIHALLKQLFQQGQYVAAICAAPTVLASAGLLEHKKATCYPNSLKLQHYPNIQLIDAPVVVDDKVITSRGPGTAMDFALQLIEQSVGKSVREQVETGLVRPR